MISMQSSPPTLSMLLGKSEYQAPGAAIRESVVIQLQQVGYNMSGACCYALLAVFLALWGLGLAPV